MLSSLLFWSNARLAISEPQRRSADIPFRAQPASVHRGGNDLRDVAHRVYRNVDRRWCGVYRFLDIEPSPLAISAITVVLTTVSATLFFPPVAIWMALLHRRSAQERDAADLIVTVEQWRGTVGEPAIWKRRFMKWRLHRHKLSVPVVGCHWLVDRIYKERYAG